MGSENVLILSILVAVKIMEPSIKFRMLSLLTCGDQIKLELYTQIEICKAKKSWKFQSDSEFLA